MDIVWQAEDSLRERKVESDLKDLLKTLVAFANSVAPNDTAKIFIGERDDGVVQGVRDPDAIQKRVKKEADRIYPEIYFKTEVYERDGKSCVRVDVKHNGLGPHFGGPAWVRKGTETIKASEALYQQMIELRHGKVRELVKWLNREITVEGTRRGSIFARSPAEIASIEWSVGIHQATLVAVNTHWATFNVHGSSSHRYEKSEPMERLLLSRDDEKNRLKVVVMNWVV